MDTGFNCAQVLGPVSDVFVDMMNSVMGGAPLTDAVEAAGRRIGLPHTVAAGIERRPADPMTACYIDSSFPALLHFAYKYSDSVQRALLANANAGGRYSLRLF